MEDICYLRYLIENTRFTGFISLWPNYIVIGKVTGGILELGILINHKSCITLLNKDLFNRANQIFFFYIQAWISENKYNVQKSSISHFPKHFSLTTLRSLKTLGNQGICSIIVEITIIYGDMCEKGLFQRSIELF